MWLMVPLLSIGQTKSQEKKANRIFKNRTELHFRFLLKKKEDIGDLTRRISIDHVKGDTVWAFANKRGLLGFYEQGYSQFTILETPAEQFKKDQKKNRRKKNGLPGTAAFDVYPTYPQYVQAMQDMAAQYPSICRLVDLGTLPSGRKILALKITDSLNKREFEPRFFYTSTMHGDETAGYPLMLKLADTLLKSYGQNPRLTQMVNEMEIWINPLANPDGTYRTGNNAVTGATRFNANNVDLNRNYPDPQDGLHPDGNAYQPETKIFMAFADTMDFVMSANFHGGAEVANFPWDTWQRRHADEIWWTAESKRFADSARVNAPANFFNQLFGYPNLPGVVQGFDWYEVNGGRQDYMNWFRSCRELTVELSNTKLLPVNQINNHWKYYAPALLNFMEASRFGIKGLVKDACTGKPVRARVLVLNHDKDSSHVYSSLATGQYHRPIANGTYSIQFSAPGYETQTIANLTLSSSSSLRQDVNLQPQAPVADFQFSKTEVCSPMVQFMDKSGSGSQWLWDFGDGQTSTLQNPEHTYASDGPFTVSLTVTNCAGNNLIQKPNLIQNWFSPVPVCQGDSSNCGAKVHRLQSLSGGNVEWFSAPSGGARLDSGSQFFTAPLPTTTPFYAQSVRNLPNGKVGAASNSIGGGGYFTANAYHYLIFDCFKNSTLRSVKVYANTTGNRTIQLRNANSQVISSRVVNIPQGESRINLNFDIPSGQGFQLGMAGGTTNNLYRNNTGAAYPYTFDGVVNIIGNSAGNPAIYYFFYDWELATRCESNRTEVMAIVNNAPQPVIIIQTSNSSLCQGDTAFFSATVSNSGSNPQIAWLVNNQSVGVGLNFSSSILSNGAQVQARVLSEDSCAVNNPALSVPISMTILPRPASPLITQSGALLISSVTNGNQWFLNGSLLSGQSNDSLWLNESGWYWARVLGTNGCFSNPSDSVLFTPVFGELNKSSMQVSFNDEGLILSHVAGVSAEFQITDALGRSLKKGKIRQGQNQIDLNSIPSGIYFLQTGRQTRRFSWVPSKRK